MFGDCHVHLAMDGVDYKAAMARHQPVPDEEHIRAVFRAYEEAGITFLRDGGDAYGVSERARTIAPEYGIDYRSPLFAIHKKGHYGRIVGRAWETFGDFAALVEEAAEKGADFIKIMTTGIMDFNRYGSIVVGDPLEAGEVRAIVAMAHAAGMAVMSHTNGKQAVLDALVAGVDSVEHGNYIDEECLRAFLDTGACLVPTSCVARNLLGASSFDQSVLAAIWEQSARTMARAVELGVTVACGSDGGAVGTPHAQGTVSEYRCFLDAVGDKAAVDAALARGEAYVKDKFKRALS